MNENKQPRRLDEILEELRYCPESILYQLDYDYLAKGNSVRNFDRVMRIRGSGGIERESGLDN